MALLLMNNNSTVYSVLNKPKNNSSLLGSFPPNDVEVSVTTDNARYDDPAGFQSLIAQAQQQTVVNAVILRQSVDLINQALAENHVHDYFDTGSTYFNIGWQRTSGGPVW